MEKGQKAVIFLILKFLGPNHLLRYISTDSFDSTSYFVKSVFNLAETFPHRNCSIKQNKKSNKYTISFLISEHFI